MGDDRSVVSANDGLLFHSMNSDDVCFLWGCFLHVRTQRFQLLGSWFLLTVESCS